MAHLFEILWVLRVQPDCLLQDSQRLLDAALLSQDDSMHEDRIMCKAAGIFCDNVIDQIKALLIVLCQSFRLSTCTRA
jgi:hypothetical protein